MVWTVRNPLRGGASLRSMACCALKEVRHITLRRDVPAPHGIMVLATVAHALFYQGNSQGGLILTERLTCSSINTGDPVESAYLQRDSWTPITDAIKPLVDELGLGSLELTTESLYNPNENHLVNVWMWIIGDAKEAYKKWWLEEIEYADPNFDTWGYSHSQFPRKEAGGMPAMYKHTARGEIKEIQG